MTLCYDDADVTESQFEAETYDEDTEGGARAVMLNEASPLASPKGLANLGERESVLTSRGDSRIRRHLSRWKEPQTLGEPNMTNVIREGNSAGASPAAPTFPIPKVEYNEKRKKRLCAACMVRRTRWIFRYSRFTKVRLCFRCMSILERAAVALATEETLKAMRGKR